MEIHIVLFDKTIKMKNNHDATVGREP